MGTHPHRIVLPMSRPRSIAKTATADDVRHLSVRVSNTDHQKLKRSARKRGITVGALVRELLQAVA